MPDVDIDPEYREFIAEQAREEGGIPPRHSLSTAGARGLIEADMAGDEDEPLPVDQTRDLSVPGPEGGIPVRLYWPEGEGPHPVLVWIHGGGWVRGTLDTAGGMARAFARRADCMVVSVDYRQAPEHPFPAAFEDSYAVVEWAHDHVGRLGGDPDRIAVGGHSAGGNLSAAVSLAARDRGDDLGLVAQLLLSPVMDFDFTTDSYRRFDLDFWTEVCPEGAGGYPLSREDMAWYRERYLARGVDACHPYAAPLQARSVAGVPPALVATSDLDPLRDEGAAYADRLRESGVPVDHRNYPAVFHSYLAKFDELDGADEDLDAVAAYLREAFDD
ncbi:MAG: alpha/beta hydrolase [Halobacteriaceae archaeon]